LENGEFYQYKSNDITMFKNLRHGRGHIDLSWSRNLRLL